MLFLGEGVRFGGGVQAGQVAESEAEPPPGQGLRGGIALQDGAASGDGAARGDVNIALRIDPHTLGPIKPLIPKRARHGAGKDPAFAGLS